MNNEWESMTIDELVALRDLMQQVLGEKLLARKSALERRLQSLNELSSDVEAAQPRRS